MKNTHKHNHVDHLKPGDFIIARCKMLSWDSFEERGAAYSAEDWIFPGQCGLILEIKNVGKNVRILLLSEGKLKIFSNKQDNVLRNWTFIRHD